MTVGNCSANCGKATKECGIHVRIIREARYGGKKCPPEGYIHNIIICDDLPDCGV